MKRLSLTCFASFRMSRIVECTFRVSRALNLLPGLGRAICLLLRFSDGGEIA